jgi:hypothetical protein
VSDIIGGTLGGAIIGQSQPLGGTLGAAIGLVVQRTDPEPAPGATPAGPEASDAPAPAVTAPAAPEPAPRPPPTAFGNRIAGLAIPFEFRDWVNDCGHDTYEAWNGCDRADWMVRLLVEAGFDRKKITKIALEIADDALQLVPSGRTGLKNAMVCAGNWALGQAPLAQVQLAVKQAHDGNAHTQTFSFYACAAAAHSCIHPGDAANAIYATAEAQATYGNNRFDGPAPQVIATYLAKYADIVRKHCSAVELGAALGV